MKFQLRKEQNGTGRILFVECDKGDEFAYIDAERVQRGDLSAFLPFACQLAGKSYEVRYGVGQSIALDDVLESTLAPEHLRAIFVSILDMMRQCEDNDLSRLRVVFDSRYAFYDYTQRRLRFAYVPMRTYVSTEDIATLLDCLCRKARVSNSDRQFVFAAWDYACRSSVLTSIDFERFLQEWGITVSEPMGNRRKVAQSVGIHDERALHGWDFVSDLRNGDNFKSESGDVASSALASSDEPMFTLVLASSGQRVPLSQGSYVIGRAEGCDIVVENAIGMSRRHACITVHRSSCTIEDLGSTNGVVVNGRRLDVSDHALLAPGDSVTLGQERFKLIESGA